MRWGKGRAGTEAPTCVVEVMSLRRGATWSDRGDAHIELPAVDLPVSRTGLTMYHSPRYDVDPKPGASRVESDEGPWSPALRGAPPPAAPASPPALAEGRGESDARDFKALMDRFQKEAGRTRQGAVPIAIAFPAI